jgi:hypothetical protein
MPADNIVTSGVRPWGRVVWVAAVFGRTLRPTLSKWPISKPVGSLSASPAKFLSKVYRGLFRCESRNPFRSLESAVLTAFVHANRYPGRWKTLITKKPGYPSDRLNKRSRRHQARKNESCDGIAVDAPILNQFDEEINILVVARAFADPKCPSETSRWLLPVSCAESEFESCC